jgi:hypothetical protein
MACFSGRAGTAPKMARRATTRPGTMPCSMEAPPSGCRRRSVRGIHRRRDLIAYPRVGNPPAPDLRSTGVRAELAAAGSRGDGVGSRGEQKAAAGAVCGRRRRRPARSVVDGGGGRREGMGVAGWRLGAGRLAARFRELPSARARGGGWSRGEEEGGGRGVAPQGRNGGREKSGREGGWPVGDLGQLGLEGFDGLLD